VQVPEEPDREIALPAGSTAEALPSVLVSGAQAPGVVVEGSGLRVMIRGQVLARGERWLLRPGETAQVGEARILAGSDDLDTAALARAILLAALRGEEPDCEAGFVVLGGPDAGRRLPRRDGVLGRGRAAALQLGDPSLSRGHARIRLDGPRVLIEDLGSKNGLWMDGRRISSLREIHPGGEVRAGRTVLALGVAPVPDPLGSPPVPGRGARAPMRRTARTVLAVAILAAAAAAALAF
jgi:S-DNA-T family DNA segregation ATPase FtsK/SpoIIIE